MRKFFTRAALAGALAVVLTGAGVTAANAAPVPQPDGSPGAFYLFDENVELAETNLSFQKNTYLRTSASKTDPSARVMQADYLDATELADPNIRTWMFVSTQANLSGGVNTWNAYGQAVSSEGGVLEGNYTMEDMISGGDINKVFTDGGSYYAGIAWTNVAGAVVYGTVYRTITVTAGTTAYTVSPVVEGPAVVAPAVTTQPTSASVTEGADAVFTAAASGTPTPTVKWESSTNGTNWVDVPGATSASLTVPAVTLAQSGTQYRAVFTNAAGTDTTEPAQLTVSYSDELPTDPAKTVTIAEPVNGVVTIDAGVGNAGQSFKAKVWPSATDLGTVTTDAAGVATIAVPAALQDGAEHTFALRSPSDNALVVWGSVVVPEPEWDLTADTALTAEVTNSGKFALEGVNTAVNLTPIAAIKRGATTAPVALGAFTVTDDRDNLVGWNLNASVTDFKTAANDTIPNTALGLAPKKVGESVEGITARATPKVAGEAWASTLVAEGAAGSNTVETGTQFDADLTFKAPEKAKKGTYTSTLTLTLSSK